jgi:hypothetical protein
MSYQRAPIVNSEVSDKAILASPKIPFWLSVLLISLKNTTGSTCGLDEK